MATELRDMYANDADAHKVQRSGEALQKKLDPDHSKRGVQIQIVFCASSNSFVALLSITLVESPGR